MADGKDDSPGKQGLRPAVPHSDGPLSGSGAAPGPTDPPPVPDGGTPARTDTPAPVTTPTDATRVDAAGTDATRVDAAGTDATRVDAAPVTASTADAGQTGGAAASGARGLRRVRPVAAARAAGRTGAAWSRSPGGRVVVPGVLAILLIGGAGAAGAFLVPDSVDTVPVAGASASLVPGAAVPSGAPVVPGDVYGSAPGYSGPAVPPGPTAPGAPVGGAPTGAVMPGGRPADALVGWAQQVGPKVGIPPVAAQAYGYAELVLSRATPACRLSWTTVAALAKVESDHGSVNGAVLGPDGKSQPAIVGLPLDGKGGRQLVPDTDRGALDGDAVFDRAMGPLQFIPSTWRENAVDADNDGITDPNDIDDAALTTAMYLCRNGRDMSKADDWWNAVLSYNNVQPYAQQVFTEANGYGQRSRT